MLTTIVIILLIDLGIAVYLVKRYKMKPSFCCKSLMLPGGQCTTCGAQGMAENLIDIEFDNFYMQLTETITAVEELEEASGDLNREYWEGFARGVERAQEEFERFIIDKIEPILNHKKKHE